MSLSDDLKNRLAIRKEIYLRIKARPGASRTAMKEISVDEDGETVKINIAAQPERGKANEELIRFLGKEFKVGKPNIKIISGATDRIKLIKIKI